MSLLGQASGGWTESSSALRILHVGIRNSVSPLTADAFTQTNPPIVTTAGTVSTSLGALTEVLGVLSGSVAFNRPDGGNSGYVGGPHEAAFTLPLTVLQVVPLGCFINNAAGNAYENLPASASGKGPYVSGYGTYGNTLFETALLASTGGVPAGTALTYIAGQKLVASRNGWLQPTVVFYGGAYVACDVSTVTAEVTNGASASTTIGILKVAPDSGMNAIVYDQRI